MEVDRQQAYINAYRREARNALQRFIDGERDDAFLLHAFEFIRSYLQVPRSSNSPPTADPDILILAQALQIHLSGRGFQRQILALWPQLIGLAGRLSAPILYVELVKFLAVVKDRQGDSEEANMLYEGLLQSSQFSLLPVEVKADVLHQAGTTLVWQGQLTQGRLLLNKVLTLAEQYPTDQNHRNQVNRDGVRSSLNVTPLWESKAYALNQLGNISSFRVSLHRRNDSIKLAGRR
ncbi:MAG: hypothetical protein R3E79_51780 [Caldilineaceae bacterium]